MSKKPTVNKVVLAYSGGLDTSVIVPWLRENYRCQVICFCADIGQGDDDLRGLAEKAINSGASKVYIEDLRGIATPVRAESTIALLDRLGVLAARPLLIHCVHALESDVRRIADSGAAVAHCPAANARLGHGIAPIAEMIASGGGANTRGCPANSSSHAVTSPGAPPTT